MAKSNLTAERLRELLKYDPETGLFTWRLRKGRCVAGSLAGSTDNHGYVVIRLDWAIYKAGRLAWMYMHGNFPKKKLRYIDRDTANNRITNLTEDGNKVPKKCHPELTAELLRNIVRYDPLTGFFYRLRTRAMIISDTSDPYIRISINGKRYQAHRLAWLYMTGEWPPHEIDHKDRSKHNNVWTNLRCATTKQNQENITKRANTSSGVTGVSWSVGAQKWVVSLMNFGKRIYLGNYISLEEAIEARRDAERRYFTHSPACEPLHEGPCEPSPQGDRQWEDA